VSPARWIKLAIGLALPLAVLLIPRSAIPIEGLTVMQHRTVAVFVLAMCFWVLEPIPIFATSVLVIVAELLFMSDKGFTFAMPDAAAGGGTAFGDPLSHRSVMATFADPIIMLFLGGFFLGAAATKYQLDTNLGRVMLRPFGTRPSLVMLGMMVITAVFSMFMSNTATTAMMLAVLMPVLRMIDADDPGRIGFVLAIPFAANVGGIGTPIGTPPNAVGLKFLTADGQPLISFAGWMAFAVPFAIVLLLATWALLIVFFRPKPGRLKVTFEGRWLRSPAAWIVYITSAATILLWVLSGPLGLGLSSSVVAMIPVAVFVATGVITSADLKTMGWDVLWLVAGGFALGLALEETGLGARVVASIPFGDFSPLVVVALACGVTYIMANFMSNTATANLLMPIMAALAVGLPTLEPLGGKMMLVLMVTFTASLSMALPISTPPNAMAYATGWINTNHMAKAGLLIGLVGLGLLAVMAVVLEGIGFYG